MFKYGPKDENESERYEKIKEHIEKFDKILINSLMVDRETKYYSQFKPHKLKNVNSPGEHSSKSGLKKKKMSK